MTGASDFGGGTVAHDLARPLRNIGPFDAVILAAVPSTPFRPPSAAAVSTSTAPRCLRSCRTLEGCPSNPSPYPDFMPAAIDTTCRRRSPLSSRLNASAGTRCPPEPSSAPYPSPPPSTEPAPSSASATRSGLPRRAPRPHLLPRLFNPRRRTGLWRDRFHRHPRAYGPPLAGEPRHRHPAPDRWHR